MYTSTVNYLKTPPLTSGQVFNLKPTFHRIVKRHYETFDHKYYEEPLNPFNLFEFKLNTIPKINALRLVLKDKFSNKLCIPHELRMLTGFIQSCVDEYETHFNDLFSQLIYITVRTGQKNYYKTAAEWHVDGFQGARIPRHIPDLGFIWSNCYPTLFSLEKYDLHNFDYAKYNVNSIFAKKNVKNMFQCTANQIYMFDPYMVHKAPDCDFKQNRIMIRLHMSSVEIEDPTNTLNPMLPHLSYPERMDVRDLLLNI